MKLLMNFGMGFGITLLRLEDVSPEVQAFIDHVVVWLLLVAGFLVCSVIAMVFFLISMGRNPFKEFAAIIVSIPEWILIAPSLFGIALYSWLEWS